MDEYISREEAVDDGYLSDWYIASVGDESPVWTDAHIDELLNDFIVIPKDTKAADVQPVKHGYWIKQPEKFQIHEDVINSNYLYSCSCCNASDLHSERANNDGEVKFCWRCGARMDGDAE